MRHNTAKETNKYFKKQKKHKKKQKKQSQETITVANFNLTLRNFPSKMDLCLPLALPSLQVFFFFF